MSIAAIPVKVTAEEPKTIRVICNPQNLDPARTGPIRLPVGTETKTTSRGKGAKNEDLGVDGIWLNPGLNPMGETAVRQFKSSPWFESLEQMGVIKIMDPLPLADGEVSTGTTKDYNPRDAMEIVRSCDDIEWLRECNAKETDVERTLVKKAIVARIQELRKAEQQMEEARRG